MARRSLYSGLLLLGGALVAAITLTACNNKTTLGGLTTTRDPTTDEAVASAKDADSPMLVRRDGGETFVACPLGFHFEKNYFDWNSGKDMPQAFAVATESCEPNAPDQPKPPSPSTF